MKRQICSIAAAVACLVAGGTAIPATGCPFCEAGSQTLSERIATSDVAVVAKLASTPTWDEDEEAADRPPEKSTFKIERVLKGQPRLGGGTEVKAYYFGEGKLGTTYLLMGTEQAELLWSAPVPLSQRGVEYIVANLTVPKEGPKRLAFFEKHLEDEDPLLAADAYEEFARAPYHVVVAMKETMNRERLIDWIRDPQVSNNHRRLYLTMLGVCGTADDVAMLERMLVSEDGGASAESRGTSAGLDALVACYLKLKGPDGLPLIEDRFLKNHDAEFTDTYAAITALRFIAEQTDTVPRERVAKAFHHMLDRPEADLVVADLARWEDWSVMPRLVELFKNADEDSTWVRQPIARYLMVCPLPEAKQHLKELRSIDAEAVERAGSVLALLSGRGRSADDAKATASNEQDVEDPAGRGEPDAGATDATGENASTPPSADNGDPAAREPSSQKDVPGGAKQAEPESKDNHGDAASDDSLPETDPREQNSRQEERQADATPQQPPRYITVLGVPLLGGLALLIVMWLVLNGVGNPRVR